MRRVSLLWALWGPETWSRPRAVSASSAGVVQYETGRWFIYLTANEEDNTWKRKSLKNKPKSGFERWHSTRCVTLDGVSGRAAEWRAPRKGCVHVSKAPGATTLTFPLMETYCRLFPAHSPSLLPALLFPDCFYCLCCCAHICAALFKGIMCFQCSVYFDRHVFCINPHCVLWLWIGWFMILKCTCHFVTCTC